MFGVQVVEHTLNSDSMISPTSAVNSDSSAISFGSPPSSSGDLDPMRIASIDASRIGFLLSFIAPLIRGANTIFPSFPCTLPSTSPRIPPMTRAATGFRLL